MKALGYAHVMLKILWLTEACGFYWNSQLTGWHVWKLTIKNINTKPVPYKTQYASQ